MNLICEPQYMVSSNILSTIYRGAKRGLIAIPRSEDAVETG